MADPKEQQPEFEDFDPSSFGEPGEPGPSEELEGAEAVSADSFDMFGGGEPVQTGSGLPFDMEDAEAATDASEAEDALEPAALATGVEETAEVASAQASGDAAEEALVDGSDEEAGEKKSLNWIRHVEWVGVALVITAIYLLFSLWKFTEKNAVVHTVYWALMVLVPFTLWKTRDSWKKPALTAPFTVMLGITVMALTTAVYCLSLELAAYEWDMKAKSKPSLTAPAAAQPAAANANKVASAP